MKSTKRKEKQNGKRHCDDDADVDDDDDDVNKINICTLHSSFLLMSFLTIIITFIAMMNRRQQHDGAHVRCTLLHAT